MMRENFFTCPEKLSYNQRQIMSKTCRSNFYGFDSNGSNFTESYILKWSPRHLRVCSCFIYLFLGWRISSKLIETNILVLRVCTLRMRIKRLISFSVVYILVIRDNPVHADRERVKMLHMKSFIIPVAVKFHYHCLSTFHLFLMFCVHILLSLLLYRGAELTSSSVPLVFMPPWR